jgi:antitoxin component YwqK of YwqJK toxin-antitoxin module
MDKVITWHKPMYVKSVAEMVDGRFHGKYLEYDTDGELVKRCYYKN